MPPFKTLFGQDPSLLLKGNTISFKDEDVKQLTRQRDELAKLRANLLKARDQLRAHANKHG